MGGSVSCKMCKREMPGGVKRHEREEYVDRIIDRVKTTTYTCASYSCYHIEEIKKVDPEKSDTWITTKEHVGYEKGCYYCSDCFWKSKYEIEMRSPKEAEVTDFEYFERLNEQKGRPSTLIQSHKPPGTEEPAELEDICNPEKDLEQEWQSDTISIDDEESDQELKIKNEENRSFDEILNDVLALKPSLALVSDQDTLQEFQMCLLSCYATMRHLTEMQIGTLLEQLSSISHDLSDLNFFLLTQTLARLCKNQLHKEKEQESLQYPDDIASQFLADLIAAGDGNRTCAEVCIAKLAKKAVLAKKALKASEDLQEMLLATVTTNLWLPSDALACLRKIMSESYYDTQFNEVLYLQLTHRVPFQEDIPLKGYVQSSHITDSIKGAHGYQREKELHDIIAEISGGLEDEDSSMIEKIVSQVKEETKGSISTHTLIDDAKISLKELADQLSRSELRESIVTALKAFYYCVFESLEYYPSLTQLVSVCILLLSHQSKVNRLLEVMTGEGKSLIITMFAAALALQGKKVDVVTSSALLAQRDAKDWRPFFEKLGLKVTHNTDTEESLKLQESEADTMRIKCYEKHEIVYGTVSSFSADVLRHTFEMKDVKGSRLQEIAIIDEVDMLMLDEGVQFTYLSHHAAVLRHVEPVLALIWSAVRQNSPCRTNNGGVLYAGVPKYIHNIIFEGITCMGLDDSTQLLSIAAKHDIISHNILQQILDAKTPELRKKAMKALHTKNMLQLVGHLEGYLPYRLNAYMIDDNGELVHVPLVQTTDKPEAKKQEFSLLVMDEGVACPLHTQAYLADGVQKMVASKCDLPLKGSNSDTYHIIDGKQYFEGVSHYFHDVLFSIMMKKLTYRIVASTKLLYLAVKYKLINKQKFNQFTCTNHHQTKKKIMKNFDFNCLVYFIQEINKDPDVDLPFNIVPFILLREGVISLLPHFPIQNQKATLAVLVQEEEGLLCPLYSNDWQIENGVAMHSEDGSSYWVGPADFFHEVIFSMMNSASLLQLAVEQQLMPESDARQFVTGNFERNAIETFGLDKILALLRYLESCHVNHGHYAVYDQNADLSLQIKNKQLDNKVPEALILFKGKGKLCQLYARETIEIPGFLREFVTNQLPVYVDSAFTALLMTEKREYVVRRGKIVPVDYQNSGVIETNKRWGGGLQQMLEMKHQLQISPMSVVTNYLSHIEFFNQYTALYGLSGTIGLSPELDFLKKVYRLQSCKIPTFYRRKFYERREIIVDGSKEMWLNKIHSVVEKVTRERSYAPQCAVLILCEDIHSTYQIERYLKSKGHSKLFTICGSDSEEFKNTVKTPRSPGDIIIATNLAGRGTDIRLEPEVNEGGGLFCLLTFLPKNRRVELQAFGRTARCGNPGSAQLILHAASIPHQYRQLDISTIRELRKHQETHRLNKMANKDVKEVQIRGNLFSEHCKLLQRVHGLLEGKEERPVVIDCLNELWGQWLQAKQADITHQRWWEVQIDLSHLQQDWQSTLKERTMKLPGQNFLHYINLAQSQFTAIAYHNRAYCRICTRKENYIEESITDLGQAKDLLLKVYIGEVFIINQCCKAGSARSDTKSDLSQTNACSS